MAEKIRYEKKKTRLTEKYQQPPESLIRIFMGIEAWKRLMRFEEMLRERYDVSREIRFPFGNEYGWSFRYSHKKSLLLYVFFEEGGFAVLFLSTIKALRRLIPYLANCCRKYKQAGLTDMPAVQTAVGLIVRL